MSSRRERRSQARGTHVASGTHRARGGPRPLLRRPAVLLVSALALVIAIALIALGGVDTSGSSRVGDVPGVRVSGNALGSDTAPVTVEVWSDYQCPFCRLFAQGAQRELIRTEVAQGQVRLVHRDLAFLGPESELAAQAADCAGEQNRYFDYHDRLFAEQQGENRGTYSKDALKRFAVQLGLTPSFNACLDSGRYAAEVRADRAEGNQKGIRSTPTLLVNGKKFEGNLGIAELRRIIDAAR